MNRFWPFRECLGMATGRAPAPVPLSCRLPALVGLRCEVQALLANLRVVLVGVGSIGMRIAEHFARLQVAELWLIDSARYKPQSLITHPIHRLTNLPKATHTARLCKQISPKTRVFYFANLVQDLPLDAFAQADLCLMATDNLAAEIEVGRRCVALGKRLVQASLHGETLTAQVRVFGNASEGPCPACGFGAIEWQQLAEQVRYSCEGSGNGEPANALRTALPTRSTSHLCGIGADLAVNQSLRLALNAGEPVADTILEYCGFTNRTITAQLERNPACRCDHARWKLVRATTPLRQYSLATLLDVFAGHDADGATTVSISGADWIEAGRCRCSDSVAVRRFVAAGHRRVGKCRRCKGVIQSQPFATCQTVTASLLGESALIPLNRLGIKECAWVLLRSADSGVLVQDPQRAWPEL